MENNDANVDIGYAQSTNAQNNAVAMMNECPQTHFLLDELKHFTKDKDNWKDFLNSDLRKVKKITKERWEQFLLVELKKKNIYLNATRDEDGYIVPESA